MEKRKRNDRADNALEFRQVIDFLSLDALRGQSSPEPNTGCFIWVPSKPTYRRKRNAKRARYPRVSLGGMTIIVTRAAWILKHGKKIPDGQFMCHTCDNRWCVNPDHVFPGTLKDNMDDAISKNRAPQLRSNKSKSHYRRWHNSYVQTDPGFLRR